MNRALWRKSLADAWLQLLISCVLLILFGWLFVWLMSLFRIPAWGRMLDLLPKFVERLLGLPLANLATPTGQVSVLYVHVITMLVCVGWALGRGSDPIAGEIGRGTMDLVLTLPVWRAAVLAVPAIVATAGAAVVVASLWLGTWIGLRTVDLGANLSARQFLPGAVNLFAMTFCLTGLTALVSSWSRDRWRVILTTGAVFIISMILKMVARMWEPGAWLRYLSFLTAFEPQRLILLPEEGLGVALRYNGTLLALGLISYLMAAVIFTRRDIPAPLS